MSTDTSRAALSAPRLDELLAHALDEDLHGGDLTSEACVERTAHSTAEAVARSPLVVCGGQVFSRVFALVDAAVRVEEITPDGRAVDAGDVLWRVEGPSRSLLMAERTALNFVQRMSGTATLARTFVRALPEGSKTRIVDTRKTTPGLRALERYAVRVGGAYNHRDSLGSAVLIKENHIRAAGGIGTSVSRARSWAPHTTRVEIEVTSLSEMDEAMAAGADIIMLDNFEMSDVHAAVARAAEKTPRPLLEVSGGVTAARVHELAEAGVDIISAGALTHSAPAADISLLFARGSATRDSG